MATDSKQMTLSESQQKGSVWSPPFREGAGPLRGTRPSEVRGAKSSTSIHPSKPRVVSVSARVHGTSSACNLVATMQAQWLQVLFISPHPPHQSLAVPDNHEANPQTHFKYIPLITWRVHGRYCKAQPIMLADALYPITHTDGLSLVTSHYIWQRTKAE